MFGTQILDVAIGLIFIFLLLSLVVTAFNELVAAALKRRSATLWRGVVRLLGDETIARKIYDHPLILSLSEKATLKPSYIPSRTFVLATLDVLTGAAPPPATTADVQNALGALPSGHGLATSMTVMLSEAAGDMEEFKKALERWFDNSMDRVSGWYKRRNQWILLPMAAGVAIWANADAIALANTLYHDPTVRSALVEQAKQYATEERAEGQSRGGPPPPPIEPPADAPEFDAASSKFEESVKTIRGLAIPLGWRDRTQTEPAEEENKDMRDPVPQWSELGSVIASHGFGWLLTALAVSLGAPFWFDMLNKVVSIRNAGKSPEEKKK